MTDEANEQAVAEAPPVQPDGLFEMGGLPDVTVKAIMPEAPKKVSMEDIKAELAAVKKDPGKPKEDAGHLEVVKTQGLSETEEGNGEGEPVEAPAKAAKAEPEGEKPSGKKAIKNPFARARIVEKERNEAVGQLSALRQEIAALRASQEAAQGRLAQAQEEPEEDQGPVARLEKKLQGIEASIARGEQRAMEIIQAAQEREMLMAAEQRIVSVAEEAPEIMEGAIMHLAKVVQGNSRRAYPNASEQERLAWAHQAIQQKKIEWVANGLDPAEQLYSMAVDFGWEPPAESAEDLEQALEDAPKSKKLKALSPGDEIKAAKERAAATKSLGATPGRAVSNLTARPVTNTSELRQAVNQLVSQGTMKQKPGRSPKFSEMAAAFGIKPVATR